MGKPSIHSRVAYLALVLTVASACSGEPEGGEELARATAAQTLDAGAGTKVIGGPCVPSDGWMPRELSSPGVSPGALLLPGQLLDGGAIAQAVPAGYVDYQNSANGTIYCLPPSAGEYPQGYLTARCASDSDCPTGALCDGALCRAPCNDDTGCQAPMKCIRTGSRAVMSCRWYDNPAVLDGDEPMRAQSHKTRRHTPLSLLRR